MTSPAFLDDGARYVTTWGWPIEVGIEFERLRIDARSGDLVAEVTVTRTGDGWDGYVLHTAQVTLTATRSKAELARYLKARTVDEPRLDWDEFVEIAASHAVESHRRGDPPILLRDAQRPPDDGFLLDPIVLGRHPTTWFGDGGSFKSYLALAAAAAIHSGRGDVLGIAPTTTRRVAYLDWEFDAWEHRERLRRLVGDEMPDLVYMRCYGPLRDLIQEIHRLRRNDGIDFIVVDSVAAACGGEPESAQIALGFFEALREIGCGALCVAHTTKNGPSDERPFGSTFWHNGTRSSWLVKPVREPDSTRLRLVMLNKKANTGPMALPIHFEVAFEADQTTISRRSGGHATGPTVRLPLKHRMKELLRSGPATFADTARRLDAPIDSVQKVVKRDAGALFALLVLEGETHVSLAADDV